MRLYFSSEQAQRYCGKHLPNGDFEPGLLRFHGGYPTDDTWQDNLVDIVHPQQDRQVKSDRRSSAFVQISLFKPTINFGISSTLLIDTTEWTTIWEIWEKALSTGIGCGLWATKKTYWQCYLPDAVIRPRCSI